MNEPTYKIHGIERKKLKKELALLKLCVKNFWYHHQLEKDMASFYGGNTMSDQEAQRKVEAFKQQIKEMESELSVLYHH